MILFLHAFKHMSCRMIQVTSCSSTPFLPMSLILFISSEGVMTSELCPCPSTIRNSSIERPEWVRTMEENSVWINREKKQELNWTEITSTGAEQDPNEIILKCLAHCQKCQALFVQVNIKHSDNWILRIPRQRPRPRITLMHIIQAQTQKPISETYSLNVSRQNIILQWAL